MFIYFLLSETKLSPIHATRNGTDICPYPKSVNKILHIIGTKVFNLCISFDGFGVEESGISPIIFGEILHIRWKLIKLQQLRKDLRINESGNRFNMNGQAVSICRITSPK